MKRHPSRKGLSLMDATVTLVIVAILLALTLPAIQAAREQARASSCSANLRTLALGLQTYDNTFKVFPGGAIHAGKAGENERMGPAWWFGLLPFCEAMVPYEKIIDTQHQGRAGVPFNAQGISTAIGPELLAGFKPAWMHCPASPLPVMEQASGPIALPTYVGIAGGCDIRADSLDPLPGCSEDHGTNNPLQSAHPGGAYVAMADGSVLALSEKVDLAVLLRLAIRNDEQDVGNLPTAALESVTVGESPAGATGSPSPLVKPAGKPPVAPAARVAAESLRVETWTDATGKHTVEADFVGVKAGDVYLKRKSDGVTIKLPFQQLSAASQQLARQRYAAGAKPASTEFASPDAMIQGAMEALETGNLRALWGLLPPNYQQDVNGWIHIFAVNMDADMWQAGVGLMNKGVQVLEQKKAFILAHPQMSPQFREFIDYDQEVAILKAVSTSELADLSKLRTFDVGAFLDGSGKKVVEQLGVSAAQRATPARRNAVGACRSQMDVQSVGRRLAGSDGRRAGPMLRAGFQTAAEQAADVGDVDHRQPDPGRDAGGEDPTGIQPGRQSPIRDATTWSGRSRVYQQLEGDWHRAA